MVTFSIPVKKKEREVVGKGRKEYFRFSVPAWSVLFAGSRHLEVSERICNELVESFAKLGFGFYIGCANGVDRSFRKAVSESPHRDNCFVACVFPQRTKSSYTYGLFASVVVPKNITPKAALHRRTIWMVKRCSLVVLFPENPIDKSWGKGSKLVFRASMYHLKPVFVVSSTSPPKSIHYKIFHTSLFGVVDGWWVVPHLMEDGGTCDDE